MDVFLLALLGIVAFFIIYRFAPAFGNFVLLVLFAIAFALLALEMV